MPFGFFGISDEKVKKEKIKPEKIKKEKKEIKEEKLPDTVAEFVALKPREVNAQEISVLLIGETISLVKDFICSLKLNADEVLVKGGLSCFSTDPFTTAEIIKTKKNVEKCFTGEANVMWPSYDTIENVSECYNLNIAVSGIQSKTLSLKIVTATPDTNLQGLANNCDAVWILGADTAEEREETSYEGKIKGFISANANIIKTKPLYMIVSQFEKSDRFHEEGAYAELKPNVKNALFEGCKKIYSDLLTSNDITMKLCYAQIYGGLEFLKRDDMDRPVFYVNLDGSFGCYNPVGCHIPLFYTIIDMKDAGMEFFFDAEGEKFYSCVNKSFSEYAKEKRWNLQTIF